MSHLSFYNPQTLPWPNPRLETASIIGHTTPTSVRLWFRVSAPGDYWLVVSRQPIPTNGVPEIRGDRLSPQFYLSTDKLTVESPTDKIYPLQFSTDNDLTTVADIDRLQPDTHYYYSLVQTNTENPWILGRDETLSFQTFPENSTEFNFGFYSCHMPYDDKNSLHLGMWESFDRELSAANARFVIGAGDQVYVDGNDDLNIWNWLRNVKKQNPTLDDMVSWYRDIYRGFWGGLPVRRVFQNFPNYMIWDDHEILDGWGSYTEAELAVQLSRSFQLQDTAENLRLIQQMFRASKQVYQEYQHCHNPNTDLTIEQWDFSFNYGTSAFYTLDMRGHRDFNRDSVRVLGIEQLNRFEDWVDRQYNSGARVLFVVTPSPMVHLNAFLVNTLDIPYLKYSDDLRDNWEHKAHWEERNQVLGKVFQWSQETKQPVVFLGGDVHIGAVFSLSHPHYPEARVFQLTSSAIVQATIDRFERRILEMMVKEKGSFGDTYQFQNLQVCRQNNFGIVRVKEGDRGDISVTFDLFGETSKGDGIVEKKTIELTGT